MARPALKLVQGGLDEAPVGYEWFCGHCAAPSPLGPPAPNARVCRSCGLGLLLEVRADSLPDRQDAFLVVDSSLLVQALSEQAEALLGMSEDAAVNRPVAELLVPADAEAQSASGFAAAVADAAGGVEPDGGRRYVRPWNTFGVRMRARVTTCGPPRAALIVLEDGPGPSLRAV